MKIETEAQNIPTSEPTMLAKKTIHKHSTQRLRNVSPSQKLKHIMYGDENTVRRTEKRRSDLHLPPKCLSSKPARGLSLKMESDLILKSSSNISIVAIW